MENIRQKYCTPPPKKIYDPLCLWPNIGPNRETGSLGSTLSPQKRMFSRWSCILSFSENMFQNWRLKQRGPMISYRAIGLTGVVEARGLSKLGPPKFEKSTFCTVKVWNGGLWAFKSCPYGSYIPVHGILAAYIGTQGPPVRGVPSFLDLSSNSLRGMKLDGWPSPQTQVSQVNQVKNKMLSLNISSQI